jgi:hydroxyacylglutathione hydrolase
MQDGRPSDLVVETIVNGPFAENCYLVVERASNLALLVDPGDEDDLILEAVRRRDASVQLILNTHAHIDHVGAVSRSGSAS